MSAYLVVHVRISDRAWLRSEYTSLMPSLMARHGGEYLARGEHQQVEGAGLGDISAIIRFPTLTAAQAFWNDPEYQRIAPLRRAGSEADVILIDGVDH